MQPGGRKPLWLYESLPYIYVATGIATIVLSTQWFTYVSGAFLILAGLTVWKLRRDYRRTRLSQRRHARAVQNGATELPDNLPTIHWHETYGCGHSLLDRQHRRLFALGNDLINAVAARKSHGDIELLADELLAELEEHFRHEEDVLRQLDQLQLDEHRQTHRALLERATKLREEFRIGQLPATSLVGVIVHDLIATHVANEDNKLSLGT